MIQLLPTIAVSFLLINTSNAFCPYRRLQLPSTSPLNQATSSTKRLFYRVKSTHHHQRHPQITHVTIASRPHKLQAIPFPLDLGLEDVIYQAQSTASKLASSSINSSTLSTTSVSSLAILYFAGLLTSFSPCSLGLLPLTISYISNAAGEREDKTVFFPTIFFALGLASVFCGLGLSVAFIGGVFGSSSSSSLGSELLAILGSGVSITMGLQLLELVNIPLPSIEIGSFPSSTSSATAVMRGTIDTTNCANGICSQISYDEDSGEIIALSTTKPNQDSSANNTNVNEGNGNGSSLLRTFLLGGSSALVASPCATPVLTSILGFVAASRDPVLGAVLLLTYTIGYSTPLLVIGASGGQALANAQVAASTEEDTLVAKIGQLVNPLTAGILIWYGTNGLLQTLFGDPSMFALYPVMDY